MRGVSLFLLVFFTCPFVFSKKIETQTLNFFKKQKIPLSSLGIWVSQNVKGKEKEIFSLNADRLFIPASLTKVVTAATLLHHMPSDHRFETKIFSKKEPEKGVLKGDLYIKGEGDPSFVSESMWFLVNALKRTRIKKVTGDIVVDDTHFGKIQFPMSRNRHAPDEQRAYKAPISSTSFNWNSVAIHVRPGKKKGDKARIFIDPQNPFIKIINKTQTVEGSKARLQARRLHRGENNVVIVAGKMGVSAEEKTIYRSVTLPYKWVGANFKEFLKQRKIKVLGGIRKGKIPQGATLLARKKSRPLSYQVQLLLKHSNNFVADMLYQNLYIYKNKKAPLSLLDDFLNQKFKTSRKDHALSNPSGLSRKNRIKPRILGKVLNLLRNDYSLFSELLVGFPMGGVDGTLKDRMRSLGRHHGLRLKTGLLRGAVGVAGYFQKKPGEPIWQVVLIYNGSLHPFRVTEAFDEYFYLLSK